MVRCTAGAAGILIAMAAGCAPVYQPPALATSPLEGAGDLHLAASTGSQGGQFNGAYAATDYVAFRGLIQSSASAGDYFQHIGAGMSYFGGSGLRSGRRAGPRWAVSVDTGLAAARGESDAQFGSGSTDSTVHEGIVVRSAVQGEVGFESPYLDLGLGTRISHIGISHSAQSDRAGESDQALYLEPIAYVRPGVSAFKLDIQIGLALPMAGEEGVGVPLPLIFSVGATFDR